jgi:hypothetical protein
MRIIMSGDLTGKAKRKIIGRSPDWIKKFDVEEYVQNPPMIEKLYEERQLALLTSLDLENQVQSLSSRIRELELEKQRLSLRLGETRRRSFTTFTLSLLATILAAIGVNVSTDTPYGWTGWVMIASAVGLEIIAFLTMPRERG